MTRLTDDDLVRSLSVRKFASPRLIKALGDKMDIARQTRRRAKLLLMRLLPRPTDDPRSGHVGQAGNAKNHLFNKNGE